MHRDGPLLLLAGAGTGKTRVITFRIAHMISKGIKAENILAVTFTNKAAAEMRERVGQLLTKKDGKALTVSTFHSFCSMLLRHHINELGYSFNFTIATENYQIGLIRSIMTELGYVLPKEHPDYEKQDSVNASEILNQISDAKGKLLEPEDLEDAAITERQRRTAKVYELYQRRMRNMDLVDFDDLLVLVLKIWKLKPHLLKVHQSKYKYLMIDEYQDTNHVQFKIMQTLAGAPANLCVVGDDDQSIYGWRGADVGNILGFDKQFNNAQVIRLEQNYRSTESILQSANHVIANNTMRHPKKLWSGKGKGERILLSKTVNDAEEARLVAEMIKDLKARNNFSWKDFAILYRSNHQSRAFEAEFRKQKIPYQLVGSKGFYERKEILDALSYLRTLDNPRNDLDFLRILNVPTRGMGDKSVERLRHLQQRSDLPLQKLLMEDEFLEDLPKNTVDKLVSFHECITDFRQRFQNYRNLTANVDAFLHNIGYIEGLSRTYKPQADALRRRENVMEFLNAVKEFEERFGPDASLWRLCESFSLFDSNDKVEEDGTQNAAVTLMTIHASKGLEFPTVFLVGLEQGLFPHKNSVNEGGLEEERRLFYVAITRAQERLMVTHCDNRSVRGKRQKQRPSPFLRELPRDLVEYRKADEAVKPASSDQVTNIIAEMKAMLAAKP